MVKSTFKAQLFLREARSEGNDWLILVLPKVVSAKFPSRGMVMAEGAINGFHFRAALEPDGQGSHLLIVDKAMREGAAVDAGDTATLEIEPTKEWIEPEVPADFKKALAADQEAQTLWMEITPMARWDWIRWIREAKQAETRARRIEVGCSKLRSGKRRPCCFDRSGCTL